MQTDNVKEQINMMAQAINNYVHSLETRIGDLEFTNADLRRQLTASAAPRPPAPPPATPDQRVAFGEIVSALAVGDNVSHPSLSLVAAAKRVQRKTGRLFHVKQHGDVFTCYRLA